MLRTLWKSLSVNPSNLVASDILKNIANFSVQFNTMAMDNNKGPAPVLYRSLQSILSILEKPENKNVAAVKELLQIYEQAREQKLKFDAAGEVRSHPLIILEGLDGSGKSTTGSKFAKRIGAIKWQTPPKSISHIRHMFDDDKVLRTAYYSLGNYIAGLEVQILLKDQPVVMDRYWHSTAAYALVQWQHDHMDKFEMPSAGDEIYLWPDDLFKPDIVFFLDVNENVRMERLSRRKEYTAQEDLLRTNTKFRNNVIKAYKNMFNPAVTFIDSNFDFETTLKQLEEKTQTLVIQ